MKWYRAGAVAAAAALIGACTDVRETTAPVKPTVLPIGPLQTVVTGAAFSSVDEAIDGTGHCKNGNPNNNCNIYDAKKYVWLNGGPAPAQVGGPGNYFFAVLQPGGQGANDNPNDGTPKNLSDKTLSPWGVGYQNSDGNPAPSGDDYANRVFTVDANNVVTYSGTHDFDSPNNKIRLMPYDDTPNNGGVYILAICRVGDKVTDENGVHYEGYPVTPSDCKYDAFKVVKSGECEVEGCGGGANTTLSIDKTLTTNFKRTYSWSVDKTANPTTISLPPGQSTNVAYKVVVTNTGSQDGSYTYFGTVTVSNTGLTPAKNVVVTDPTVTLDCKPAANVAELGVGDDIDCTYSQSVPTSDAVSNTATVTWDKVEGGTLSEEDKENGTFLTPDLIDDCVVATDSYAGAGTLGTVCAKDSPKTFSYSRTLTAPTGTGKCGTSFKVDNTATITPNTSGSGGAQSDDASVSGSVVCGCTLGYWKNNDLFDWKKVSGVYAFAALAGGANGGTGDWYWKNTSALAPGYAWPYGAPSVYRTGSSKLNNQQAFGVTALGLGEYSSIAGLGFYQALSLPGGTTFVGKAQNLMRQATAALLNGTWDDDGAGPHSIGYPLTPAQVVSMVNAALLTKDATKIDNLQKVLAGYKQSGTQDLNRNDSCPINAQGAWWPH